MKIVWLKLDSIYFCVSFFVFIGNGQILIWFEFCIYFRAPQSIRMLSYGLNYIFILPFLHAISIETYHWNLDDTISAWEPTVYEVDFVHGHFACEYFVRVLSHRKWIWIQGKLSRAIKINWSILIVMECKLMHRTGCMSWFDDVFGVFHCGVCSFFLCFCNFETGLCRVPHVYAIEMCLQFLSAYSLATICRIQSKKTKECVHVFIESSIYFDWAAL